MPGASHGQSLGCECILFSFRRHKNRLSALRADLSHQLRPELFPPERSRKILGRFRGLPANLVAALPGTVTPFCSCTSIPLFIGFSSTWLPIGMTFSFLISSPRVEFASLVLIISIFGAKIALLYVAVGLVLAVSGGWLIERLRMEDQVEGFITAACCKEADIPMLRVKDRLLYAKGQMLQAFKKVFPYILVGVGVGVVIHNRDAEA
jgi:uncharacterized protein